MPAPATKRAGAAWLVTWSLGLKARTSGGSTADRVREVAVGRLEQAAPGRHRERAAAPTQPPHLGREGRDVSGEEHPEHAGSRVEGTFRHPGARRVAMPELDIGQARPGGPGSGLVQ